MTLETTVGCNSPTAHQVSHPDLLSDVQSGKGPFSLLERGKRRKRGSEGVEGKGEGDCDNTFRFCFLPPGKGTFSELFFFDA